MILAFFTEFGEKEQVTPRTEIDLKYSSSDFFKVHPKISRVKVGAGRTRRFHSTRLLQEHV